MELGASQSAVVALKSRVQTLKDELAEARSKAAVEMDELNVRLRKLEAEDQRHRRENVALQRDCNAARDEVHRTKEDMAHVQQLLEMDLHGARQTTTAEKSRADAAEARIAKLEAELEQATGVADGLRIDLEAVTKEAARGLLQPAPVSSSRPKPNRKEMSTSGDPVAGFMAGGSAGGGGQEALTMTLRTRRRGLGGSTMGAKTKQMVIKTLQSCGVVDGIDSAALSQLVQSMYHVTFSPRDTICRQGSDAEHLYVIETGRVELMREGGITVELTTGEIFNHEALAFEVPCPATALAAADTTAWLLDRESFVITKRWLLLEARAHILRRMRLIPAFHDMTDRQLRRLADVAEPVRYLEDELIIREGDDGDAMFVVDDGEAEVFLRSDPNRVIKSFTIGDYFGETSLLFTMTRTASVRAATAVRLVKVHQTDFLKLPSYILKIFQDNIDLKDYERAGITLPAEVRAALARTSAAGDETLQKESDTKEMTAEAIDVLATMGEGGFGAVYLARERDTGRLLAAKTMSKLRIVQKSHARQAVCELEAMTSLRHPFLLSCTAAFNGTAKVCFMLEPCLAGDLSRLLTRLPRSMPDEAAAFYIGCVSLGLAHLHLHNWIYRDLKPENILLDTQGYPKLCDFGLARQIEDRAYTRCGTPEYMAPEVVVGEGANEATDWWAVGVLTVELLTGDVPFKGETAKDVYDRILNGAFDTSALGEEAAALVSAFLTRAVKDRLGYLGDGVEDIKRDAWFKHVNWDALVNRAVTAPWVPEFDGDVSANLPQPPEGAPSASVKAGTTVSDLIAQFPADEKETVVQRHLRTNKKVPAGFDTWEAFFAGHWGPRMSASSSLGAAGLPALAE